MNLFASEWIKTRSIRITWVTAIATVAVTAIVSLLGISGLAGEWQSALPADYDPTAISLKGILVGQILMATLGAQSITSEYASGMIVTSLTVSPQRTRLLIAKAAVTFLTALATAVPTVGISFGASQAAIAAAGLPVAALSDPDVARALVCAVAYLVFTALLGLAFGTITRSSSGALAIIVAIALIVPALAPGLPGIVGEIGGTYWPTTAGQVSYSVVATGALPPLVGCLIMGLFTLYSVVAAALVLRTRDA